MPWLLLLCLAAATAGVVLQARAQPDIKGGFISIDCGGDMDSITALSFAADVGFTDSGSNYNISDEYITPSMAKNWYTLRSFPTGVRNCYTLHSLHSGFKYLVRARFLYGNYKGLSRQPIFDLYIGVNFWKTMNISIPDKTYLMEAIVIVPDEYLQVCLVNTGTGTPFITALDLRPLKNTLYPQANATHGLVLSGNRDNFGPTNNSAIIRYPDDPHDRWWKPRVNTSNWASISTMMEVDYLLSDQFEVPTAVTQTAIAPLNASTAEHTPPIHARRAVVRANAARFRLAPTTPSRPPHALDTVRDAREPLATTRPRRRRDRYADHTCVLGLLCTARGTCGTTSSLHLEARPTSE